MTGIHTIIKLSDKYIMDMMQCDPYMAKKQVSLALVWEEFKKLKIVPFSRTYRGTPDKDASAMYASHMPMRLKT